MPIIKLKPAYKDYLWGGQRLKEEYGYDYDSPTFAEAWVLSCHPDGPSIIENGFYQGKTFPEYLSIVGQEVLGVNCRRFRDFPILTKFIDAKQDLSIQVHPNNRYALKNEGQYGKSEMWVVLDAQEGAFLYYGFKQEISRDELAQRIKDNTLLEVLNKVEVHKGDILFIEAGTIHAIGKGLLIAEIQQNSNVTYRVYDYNRKDKNGKTRDLHIEKALAVTNRRMPKKNADAYPHLADCDYFTVDRLLLDGHLVSHTEGNVDDKSFLSILILDGEGTLVTSDDKVNYKKGDSIFLPAKNGHWEIDGSCDALFTTIREKQNQVSVGIAIGSSKTQIGIMDKNKQIVDYITSNTDSYRGAEAIIEEVTSSTLALLEKDNITLDQVSGVGVAVPGTVDRLSGTVVYSNNIGWSNVNIKERIGEDISCPIRVANNADCAALAESIQGAAKDKKNVVMVTLGNGVGGGIILNGKVFEGGMIGGGEIGHTVIHYKGKNCTCGRRGCLEAYVSIPALLEEANKYYPDIYTVEQFFDYVDKKDEKALLVLNQYIDDLATGLINVINVFRPDVVLLGGQLAKYCDRFIDKLSQIAGAECFGKNAGLVPEIKIAELGDMASMIGASNL